MIAADDNCTYLFSGHTEKDAAEKLDGSTPIHAFESKIVLGFGLLRVVLGSGVSNPLVVCGRVGLDEFDHAVEMNNAGVRAHEVQDKKRKQNYL